MDKSLSLSELVGELRDGMTIGIGGWGGRLPSPGAGHER